MNHSLLDMIDRFAMTFGNLALLAALPVAAIALVAHALGTRRFRPRPSRKISPPALTAPPACRA